VKKQNNVDINAKILMEFVDISALIIIAYLKNQKNLKIVNMNKIFNVFYMMI